MTKTNPGKYLVIKRLKERHAFDIKVVPGFDEALRDINQEDDEKYSLGGWIYHPGSDQRFAIVS